MEIKRTYQQLKNVYHLIKAVAANFYYLFPSKKICIIAVTGTNGKTSTVWMVNKILEEAGCKTAVSSTINFKIGSKEWVNKTKFTTRSSWEIQKFINKAVQQKCRYLVMEVSSHSLDQNRVWGTSFNAAVLTNITREHLDYHRTMREYEKAKAKLFQMTAKNFGSGVINMNNKINEPQRFLSRDMNKYFFYGREKGANFWPEANNGELVIANNVSIGKSSTKFKVDDQAFHLSLPGEINLENALASICVAKLLQLPLEKASRALSKMKLIPGRMEKVENKKGVGIIIDYALTPDSMERLGKTYVADDGKNLIWVFGSCGERDRGKRPIMGEIASKYADKIILTNEDPYNENPSRIVDEIKEGIKGKAEGEGFWVVMDRQEAIKKALSIAKKGDIVLITGKGAEENMMIKGKKIPWSDKKTVQEALQNL